MANSSLIVLLPLIGAVVGAIIGAWANSWYRAWEVQKARAQELEGLLLLIGMEVQSNDMLLEKISKPRHAAILLRNDVWDKSHTRLAQLLPKPEMLQIVVYYALVKQITSIRTEVLFVPTFNADALEDLLVTITNQSSRVKRVVEDSANEPGFFRALNKASSQVLQRGHGKAR